MLSVQEFISRSLELNLFFLRIMKEHLFFIQSALSPKDTSLIYQANTLRIQFEKLLSDAVTLAAGMISAEVKTSQEIITPFTLNAERTTRHYTDIPINTHITQAEIALIGYPNLMGEPILEQKVFILNRKAVGLTNNLIQFKTFIQNQVLSCRLFTFLYPSIYDHIIKEAKSYIKALQKIQKREIPTAKELLDQEVFWDIVMQDHSKVLRGLFDPSEQEKINTSDHFSKIFEKLAKKTQDSLPEALSEITSQNLEAVINLSSFKKQNTQGLLECKTKAIILPLFLDHLLREANHYIRLLKI
jgi:hypothetical protein